jgi:NADH-quinone oxidoreductase subunit L
MGGLWRRMPWTTIKWVIGAMSLAGIPPLAGFWSKDEILLSALNGGRYIFLVPALLTAMLTAFYMGRATFLAFFAKPRTDSKSEHAHESPLVMVGPLVVLATLAVVAGLVGSPLTKYAFGRFLGEHAEGEMDLVLAAIAVGAALAGIGYAYAMYVRHAITPDWYLRNRYVSSALSRSFWIDEVYDGFIVRPILWIAGAFRALDHAVVDGVVRGVGALGLLTSRGLAVFDRKGVDGVVDGIGSGITGAGREIRKIQTGNVQTYLLFLAGSIILLVLVFAR